MSGATEREIKREYYKLCLSTPRMNFCEQPFPFDTRPQPPRSGPSQEQRFHNKASERFDAYIDEMVPKLDAFVATLMQAKDNGFHLSHYAPKAQELHSWNKEALVKGGIKHCQVGLVSVARVPHVHGDVSLYLTFYALPQEQEIERLEQLFADFFKAQSPDEPLL